MIRKLLLAVIIISIFTACDEADSGGIDPGFSDPAQQPQTGSALSEPALQAQREKAPLLTVVAGDLQIPTAQLTTSWMFTNEDGTGTGYEADSPHALQLSDYTSHTLPAFSGVITFVFSDDYTPQSVSITRWDTKYAENNGQDIFDVLDKGEPVLIDGNAIHINNDECDYIYEIYAKWEQGSSYYAFRTSSD